MCTSIRFPSLVNLKKLQKIQLATADRKATIIAKSWESQPLTSPWWVGSWRAFTSWRWNWQPQLYSFSHGSKTHTELQQQHREFCSLFGERVVSVADSSSGLLFCSGDHPQTHSLTRAGVTAERWPRSQISASSMPTSRQTCATNGGGGCCQQNQMQNYLERSRKAWWWKCGQLANHSTSRILISRWKH